MPTWLAFCQQPLSLGTAFGWRRNSEVSVKVFLYAHTTTYHSSLHNAPLLHADAPRLWGSNSSVRGSAPQIEATGVHYQVPVLSVRHCCHALMEQGGRCTSYRGEGRGG